MHCDAPVGTVDLGNLPAIWEVLDVLEAQMDAANAQYPRTNLFCDRRFDEAKHVGERTYILAHSSILAARDSHQAFLKALRYDGIRAQASWGMIRPSFESAFYAVWMLQPNNSQTRLQRGLRVAWEQHRTHHLRLDIMKQLAAEHDIPADHPDLLKLAQRKREHEAMYDAEAASIGLSHQQMTANVSLTNELDKLSYGDQMPNWIGKWFTLTWRQLSGATHGDSGALAGLSDTQYRVQIPGGWAAQISINDDSFRSACYASAHLQMLAMNLYTSRSTPTT